MQLHRPVKALSSWSALILRIIDNIGYADLSDFFYVWQRRSLQGVYPQLFSTVLVPKTQELIAAPFRFGGDKGKAEEHFLSGLSKAFLLMRQRQDERFPMTVYYAFKQAEEDGDGDVRCRHVLDRLGDNAAGDDRGGLMRNGYMAGPDGVDRGIEEDRERACFIHCHRVPATARPPRQWRRGGSSLPSYSRELPEALRKLQEGYMAPVDFAQAAIGPGMAVFSRYAKVMEADGGAMSVRTALQMINQELDAYLTAQEGEMDQDTRFCITWFEQHGMEEGPFGEADVLARAKNTSVQGMVDAGVVQARAGKVRLLRRDEYPQDWNPVQDKRLTIWECTQYLIRALEKGGEEAAARLAQRLGGGRSEEARALAYRLYSICERKGWAQEALAYNTLAAAWGEVQAKVAALPGTYEQGRLELT